MSVSRTPWLERKFVYPNPTGFYAETLERLRGTPARLEERLRPLPADVLRQRDGNKWSIQEHAGHLVSLEALVQGRLLDFKAGLATLRAADMSNLATEQSNWRERPLNDVLAAFRAARTATIVHVDALEPDEFAKVATHPRLQIPMRLIDMLEFQAHHDDYHLATITQLIRALAHA
jgi:uncharacterized damage-inducible protein DinB